MRPGLAGMAVRKRALAMFKSIRSDPRMKLWTEEDIATASVDLREVEALVDKCGALLAGKHPAQGAAIGKLMALWLLGHDDDMREGLFTNQISQVRELIEGRE
jgi:hypothetical protein